MIKIAVCDDNEKMLDILNQTIVQEFQKYTNDFSAKSYVNGNLLLDDNNNTPFDVLFLDIDMPQISGFEIAKKLRDEFKQCFIIFITNHSELV